MEKVQRYTALEFFAGGGLARLGLLAEFDVVWANDIDPMKAVAWTTNFGSVGFALGDVAALEPDTIPSADLAWASFPCQDLSLAGDRAGLAAKRSGTFFGFTNVTKSLVAAGKAPKLLVIENVSGLLTSHNGQDFVAVMEAMGQLGYRGGALEIDARYFVPQSRPRVFIVCVRREVALPMGLVADGPKGLPFATPAILKAHSQLPDNLASDFVWWSLPAPPVSRQTINDVIDHSDLAFWPEPKTKALLASLSARHKALLTKIQATNQPSIATVFRRTRTKDGQKAIYAEVRFDGLAGCLRTPSGGSSRQFFMFIRGGEVKVRALNAREAMRLMGVPDSYQLPKGQLTGLKIAGDGVAVPVVAWLSQHLLGKLVTKRG
jgi:DNA (cytosine-5)-methyltransferase 1